MMGFHRFAACGSLDGDHDGEDFDAMGWVVPGHSRNQVDNAGMVFAGTKRGAPEGVDFMVDVDAQLRAIDVINNWRAAHSFPLNSVQTTLRSRCKSVSGRFDVAQRTKRLGSVRIKLQRFPTTQLSQMQDIGGCRAILPEQKHVEALLHKYTSANASKGLIGQKDYIGQPKDDGYRCAHLIYKYHSDAPKYAPWNKLRIEIQIRSALQHAWATAVEAVDTFTRQQLKLDRGSDDWKRFFALASSVIAEREGTPRVPGTPDNHADLIRELRASAEKLRVFDTLAMYKAAIRHTEKVEGAKYFVLQLDFLNQHLQVTQFRAAQSEKANEFSKNLEAKYLDDPNMQIVLVSVDSMAALKRAYPNYFLDTDRFAKILTDALA